jgi:hypothetical protein
MSLKTLIHLDSLDGIQNYDPILKSYHCYNTTILINKPISNIKEISLKSLEMPIFFNNIRSANNSNVFSFIFSSSSLNFNNISIGVTIPESNYTSINSLLSALNTSISTALSAYIGVSFVLTLTNTYYITITSNCNVIVLSKSILMNNILGFSTSQTYSLFTLGNLFITTTNLYCLNVDNYINLYITNLNSGSDTNANGRLLTFKIPCNCVTGQILYLGDSNTFTQTISITDPFYVLSKLNIMILDRFGFPINGGNAFFSFTLGINYDKPIEQIKIRRFL